MALGDFFKKQFIDVIHWTEDGDGILAYRYPMQDAEIQYGAKLTVRESQMALFVNEGKFADAFGPGLYTLETQTLPLLTNLMNWDKLFQSPFKSDVYFFSTRTQTAQRWGTQNPITIRDKDFGMVRLRGFGMYSWHIKNPVSFMQKLSGTRDVYTVTDVEPHLRNLVVARMSEAFAKSSVPFLDMAANTFTLGEIIRNALAPAFEELGIVLDSFTVENLSLPEELQKRLDERIGMNMVGNLGEYTQFQAAQAIPIAAANEGGAAGMGVGLGAGMAMGQAMANAMGGVNANPGAGQPRPNPAAGGPASGVAAGAVGAGATNPDAEGAAGGDPATSKYCQHCGKSIPRTSKFCPECGQKQE
jgi:membrane protease subunit (stomatin/prohibitin family)